MAVGRQFGREASIYLTGFVGAGILQFLVIPIYTRALGPVQYGYLALTIAATTIAAGIMVLGGDVALARFWVEAKSESERKALASTWLGFLTFWSALVAIIGCVLAPWLADTLESGAGLSVLLTLGFLGLIPAQLSRMLAQILRNRFQPVPYAVTTIAVAAFNAGLGVVLGVVLGVGVYGIVLGTLVGEFLGCLVRFPLVRRSLGLSFSWGLLPPLLRFGVPYVPASLSAWVFTGADRLVIGAQASGRDDLGPYSLATSLVGPFTVLTLSVGQAWLPRVSVLYMSDPKAARDSTARAAELALAVLGVAATTIGALALWIMTLVGGSDYASGATALPFLTLGAAFYGTALFTGTGLTLTKRTGTLSAITVAAAALNLILLLVVVPWLGPKGAAISVAVCYFVLAAGTLVGSDRVFPMGVRKARLALAAGILFLQASLASTMPGAWQVVIPGAVASASAVALLLVPRGRALRTR